MDNANRVIDRCGSTSDLAKELAENGCPHGTWVSTKIQESGRGRLGRKWESLEGNLFLSLVARVEDKTLWSWVPLATAVAIVRFLRKKYPGMNFQIKWPNDLWLGGAKLGGILCEATRGRTQTFIVIGIGLNCLHSPEGLDQVTTNLTAVLGRGTLLADEIRMPLISSLLEELNQLTLNGPTQIREAYQQWSAFPNGTPIEWGGLHSVNSPSQTGRVEDLGPVGELLVKNDQGNIISLFAEDVRVRSRNSVSFY